MTPDDKDNGGRLAPPPECRRIDKWLWYARLFKSRSQASALCTAGRLRLNGVLVTKAHTPVKPGDVLVFPAGPRVRVIRVLQPGIRRGPAAEARRLYQDLEAQTD